MRLRLLLLTNLGSFTPTHLGYPATPYQTSMLHLSSINSKSISTMDGLSAAANAITIAAIAVQLAESIKKLYDFWISIKNAPEDIHAIMTDLQILSSILHRIASEAQRLKPDPSMIAALNCCSGKIKKLRNIVDDLESGFGSTSSSIRTWSALKTLFKSDRLKNFQDSLERTKSTLMLIQNIHQGY